MFNEAFWFFYWVEICKGLKFLLFFCGGLGTIISLIVGAVSYEDDPRISKFLLSRMLPLGVLVILLGVAVPPPSAFYAGAGQYVTEYTELDTTLLKLKEVVDQKIEELSEDGS